MRLIDAEHLKRWIMLRWESGVSVGYDDVKTNEILEQIDRELTFNTEHHWIPCSEGLPKTYGEYLCCDIRGEYILGMPFENEDSDTGFSVETGSEYMYACIAWMPLPEPYKKG